MQELILELERVCGGSTGVEKSLGVPFCTLRDWKKNGFKKRKAVYMGRLIEAYIVLKKAANGHVTN